jgi:hypothetical protein
VEGSCEHGNVSSDSITYYESLSSSTTVIFSIWAQLHITVLSGMKSYDDRLCGLVVRVLGYRSGGPCSIPGTTKKKVVGLERGPLSLVSTAEELLDRKVAASV